MTKPFLLLLLGVSLGLCTTSRAEEKMVTTPLLTALSSTTISGYVDTSAHWDPGTTNLIVTLPNKKLASLTRHDLLALSWASKSKHANFFRAFVKLKEKLPAVTAEQFDSRYLPLLFRLAGVSPANARLILTTPPPCAF